MNFPDWFLVCFLIDKLFFTFVLCSDFESDLGNNENNSSQVLSRRKRFIIFPEGSSFQIVFCNSFASLNPIGDIILFGYTAALAYELPQDPYSPFSHKADPLHRRMDTKTIYFTDSDGKVLFKKPFERKHIVNPAFAKRSADYAQTKDKEFQYETRTLNLSSNTDIETLDIANEIQESLTKKDDTKKEFKIDRKQMHETKHKRDFLKIEHMDENSVEFHRSSRASLYEKIEIFLKALGANGQHCLLKALCQVGQTREQSQGSFLQEILRVIFTLPKGKSFEITEHKLYDEAHFAGGSCDELYPDCTEPEEASYI